MDVFSDIKPDTRGLVWSVGWFYDLLGHSVQKSATNISLQKLQLQAITLNTNKLFIIIWLTVFLTKKATICTQLYGFK